MIKRKLYFRYMYAQSEEVVSLTATCYCSPMSTSRLTSPIACLCRITASKWDRCTSFLEGVVLKKC